MRSGCAMAQAQATIPPQSWPARRNRSRPRRPEERPDVQAARLAWREMQKGVDPKKLVFIDETWASTNMTSSKIGYAKWPAEPSTLCGTASD
jgi:hypothetical protein